MNVEVAGDVTVFVTELRLGSVDAKMLAEFKERGETPPSLHSPKYHPIPEPTLKTGVTALSSAALDLLRRNDE